METIRILKETYENLYVLAIPVRKFLEEKLPCISSQWKRECVFSILEKDSDFYRENSFDRSLEELDIYYLLKILLDNSVWETLSALLPDDSFFTKENKKLLKELKRIRNIVSHPRIKEYSSTEFDDWTKTAEKVAELFDTKLDTLKYNLHKKEKEVLLDFILEKVINPALQCKELSETTLNSIKNTKNRLEMQNTAEGIMAFFTDALNSNSGRKIAKELEKNGLLSFEKITPQVKELYIGRTIN